MSGEGNRQDQELEEILAASKKKWRELIETISLNFYSEMGISPVNEDHSCISMNNLDTPVFRNRPVWGSNNAA
jgi:hypothetical protein